MSGLSVVVDGTKAIEKMLDDKAAAVRTRQDAAAKAGAKALVPFVKAELPRDPKSSRPGNLRSRVRVYQDIHGQGLATVKLTGHLPHLVYGDTKAHEIDPKGLEDTQVHGIRAHHRVQGPVQLKQALFIPGSPHPVAHAHRGEHKGAPNPLPGVLAEHRTEAARAAMEVITHD